MRFLCSPGAEVRKCFFSSSDTSIYQIIASCRRKLLLHIEMPPFVDLLIRIIELEPQLKCVLRFSCKYMLNATKTVAIVPELHYAADRLLGGPTHIRSAHGRGGTHQKYHCYGNPFTCRKDHRSPSKWTGFQSFCSRTRPERKRIEAYDLQDHIIRFRSRAQRRARRRRRSIK